MLCHPFCTDKTSTPAFNLNEAGGLQKNYSTKDNGKLEVLKGRSALAMCLKIYSTKRQSLECTIGAASCNQVSLNINLSLNKSNHEPESARSADLPTLRSTA